MHAVVRADLERALAEGGERGPDDAPTRSVLAGIADGELLGYLDARADTVSSLVAEAAEVVEAHGRRLVYLDFAGAIKGYATDIITDLAIDFIKNRPQDKPFFLMCHHKAPHREWEPALKNLALYDGVKFPEPPTLFDDYSGRGKAEHEQDMMIASTMNNRDLKLTPPPTLNAN